MSITAETGNIATLLASWWSHSQWEVRHLARNVRLDCIGLTAPDHPNCRDCGGRLNEKAASFLNERAQEMMDLLLSEEGKGRPWVRTWGDIQRKLEMMGCDARELFFGDSPLTPLTAPVSRIEVIRYVSCRSVYQHWLDRPRADGPERVRELCSNLVLRPGSWSILRAPLARLTGPGSMVWVTQGSPPPHRRTELTHLTDANRAQGVARLLGLSGYDQPEDRREKVGLMAVSYQIAMTDLRPPVVFDALNNPYFFPGLRSESQGRVASLNADFSPPWERTEENSTIPEWVHTNGEIRDVRPEIEVVGFFED